MAVLNSATDVVLYHQPPYRYQQMVYVEEHLVVVDVAARIAKVHQHPVVPISAVFAVVSVPLSVAEWTLYDWDVRRSWVEEKRIVAVEHWGLRLENSTPLPPLQE